MSPVQPVHNPNTVPPPRYRDFDVLPTGGQEQIHLTTRDPDSQRVAAPTDITFNLIDPSDVAIATGSWQNPSGATFEIFERDVGYYFWNFDAATYNLADYLAFYTITWGSGRVERQSALLAVADNDYFRLIPRLRLIIDKARKSVLPDPNALELGYEDRHCVFYLDMGVTFLNSISPQTGFTVATWPASMQSILLWSAAFSAIFSQMIFAVDTDYDYSLGGNSLNIDHFNKLNSALQAQYDRWFRQAEQMKQNYRFDGLALVSAPFGWHIARYLRAAPPETVGRIFSLMSPATWSAGPGPSAGGGGW